MSWRKAYVSEADLRLASPHVPTMEIDEERHQRNRVAFTQPFGNDWSLVVDLPDLMIGLMGSGYWIEWRK